MPGCFDWSMRSTRVCLWKNCLQCLRCDEGEDVGAVNVRKQGLAQPPLLYWQLRSACRDRRWQDPGCWRGSLMGNG